MKGLKGRLLLAFLSTIILPILSSFLMLSFYSSNLEGSAQEQDKQIEILLSKLRSEIRPLSFEEETLNSDYQTLRPLLETYKMDILITSIEGERLFDSSQFHSNQKEKSWSQVNPFHLQVATATRELVNVEVISNSSDTAPFTMFSDVIRYILISIGTGIVVLITLIGGWIWYFSRTVLYPIREIYTATEEMRQGNLDYPVSYKRNDEIGRFISGFDLMRTHMKEADAKKRQYEKARKELIASISHDLRTPLSSIKGYVEGLTDGVIQNEKMQQKYLNVIKAKTIQLDHLIEDLFDYTKLELGQFSMMKEQLDSRLFFQMVVQEAQLDVSEKEVQIDVAGDIPSVLMNIDPVRINQVMTNLIDNAVRYGGTKIELSFEQEVSLNEITVHLQDNGLGISKDDLPFVFDQFFRGDKSRSQDLGGTGLGLAITKSIVEAHAGRIWVKSSIGVGTTFSFTLPFFH
ncbi:sensor histidine kinase [Alkalihalophilus sp. As8PL]|uniref:histidine kinase n=1 Tax=Alkalihalophilus sp. As8PL TaxID=3237103 RepID=A0AB39BWV8_9BACI